MSQTPNSQQQAQLAVLAAAAKAPGATISDFQRLANFRDAVFNGAAPGVLDEGGGRNDLLSFTPTSHPNGPLHW